MTSTIDGRCSLAVPSLITIRVGSPGWPPAYPQGRKLTRSIPRASNEHGRSASKVRASPVPPRQRPGPPESGRSA